MLTAKGQRSLRSLTFQSRLVSKNITSYLTKWTDLDLTKTSWKMTEQMTETFKEIVSQDLNSCPLCKSS